MKYFIWSLMMFLGFIGVNAQSVVSEKADNGNYYARIGEAFNVLNYTHLRMGNDTIQTRIGGLFSDSRSADLLLNRTSSPLRIGTTSDTIVAGLTVKGANNDADMDLFLNGHGWIKSPSRLMWQLDADGGGNASFSVLDSDINELLKIAENRDHKLNAHLTVTGKVRSLQVDTFYKIIENVDWEVVYEQGDELELGYSYVRLDGIVSFPGVRTGFITTNVDLPTGAFLHTIETSFRDNNDDDLIVSAYIGCVTSPSIPLFDTTPEFASPEVQSHIAHVDQPYISNNVDCSNEIIARGGNFFTNDWESDMEIYTVKIKYTLE